ncbi:hypothetical protein CGLO_18295 [Colletotrichum gloeosporioides Cg-14]|jgi:hypothetical protein
MPLK